MHTHHITTQRAGSLDAVSATFQGTKDMNEESLFWHQTTKAKKVTISKRPRHKQCPLFCTQLRAAPKGPQYVPQKTQQQCLRGQTGQEVTLHTSSAANHSALGLWQTIRRNEGLGTLHSPWRPPRLKYVTGVALKN